ncbi:MAG: response regulator, partial [Candidatus Sericytochromatia bacterium]
EQALKLLIAEDLPDNRIIFDAFLGRTSHSVEFVEDGLSALTRFQAERFDLVLMDMQMPVLDGYAATRAIREWEREQGLAPTPIIAFTASAFKDDIETCRDAGCTGHLSKPVRRDELLATIARHAQGQLEPALEGALEVAIDAELAGLIPGFLAGRKAEVETLRQLAASGDMAGLGNLGHQLTGLGGTYGFDRISELGRELSHAAHAGQLEAVGRVIEAYADYLEQVKVSYVQPEA